MSWAWESFHLRIDRTAVDVNKYRRTNGLSAATSPPLSGRILHVQKGGYLFECLVHSQ